MALEYVGGKTAAITASTATNTTVSLASGLAGGVDDAVGPGDMVIAVFATGAVADRTLAITDTVGGNAYTLVGSELYSDGSTNDANLRVGYRFMPSTPDANVVFGPTGSTTEAGAYVIHVWRNVDPVTPLDVAATTATGTATSRPNPAAITPVTAGAKVIAACCGAGTTGTTAFTFASSLGLLQTNGANTNDGRASCAYYDWTSGALDPAAAGAGENIAGDAWAAVTLALRPLSMTDKVEFVSAQGAGQFPGTGVTITKPVGLAVGDLMVFYVGYSDATATAWGLPSGWAVFPHGTQAGVGNGLGGFLAYKIATSGDVAATNFTFTTPAANSWFMGADIVAYRNVDQTNPFATISPTQATGSSTTRTNSGVTTTRNGSRAVYVANGNDATAYPRQGFSLRISTDVETLDAVYDKLLATAGASGAISQAQPSGSWVTQMFVIQPPAQGGPPPIRNIDPFIHMMVR